MRFYAALAAFIYVVAAALPACADDSVLARARLQTFVVQVAFDDQRGAIGAGVVVSRTADTLTIATAEHVVDQKGTLQILDVTRNNYYQVLDMQRLPDYDLALIRVRAQPQFVVNAPQTALPQTGEAITVLGHTGDGFWEQAQGTVVGTGARISIDCAACAPGDSGAGVFDSQGRLLGILTRAWKIKNGGPVLYIEVEPAAAFTGLLAGLDAHR
jgi:S1-C subfamily serine protease